MTRYSNQFINVLLPLPFHRIFTYKVSCPIECGAYVQVNFRGRATIGVVWETDSLALEKIEAKEVEHVYDLPPVSKQVRGFIDWVATYYMAERGLVLKMLLSLPLKSFQKLPYDKEKQDEISVQHKTILSDAQRKCADAIEQALQQKKFGVQVLEGVTGSGKTEVYFKGIEYTKAQGKQSLILLPEIALSRQWVDRFKDRFGFAPLLWHSSLTEVQRRKNWQHIVEGEAKVIVGARSALFLPYRNLGFIVVDEEHDGSYKQDNGILYNARDMAVVRGKFENCPTLLASATPSLETLHNIQGGKYKPLYLSERHGNAVLPSINLVDMRTAEKKSRWISQELFVAASNILRQGKQVLFFLNRRGYAPFMVCAACGERPECPYCDATLVYHKEKGILRCHYCNYCKKSNLSCSGCKTADALKPCGPGIERLQEEIQELFPHASSVVISSDSVSNFKELSQAFQSIEQGRVQIILGTQMMAKGHHFPNLSLVGIVDGDLSLHGTDLRAAERTYQLLHQVAGRAGRSSAKKGSVIIQTHMPENSVMQALLHKNFEEFLQQEMEDRKIHGFPPFGKLVAIVLSSSNKQAVTQEAKRLASEIPQGTGVVVWGPTPAVLTRLKRKYRWRFLVKGGKNVKMQTFLRTWLSQYACAASVKIQIDMDPYSFI